MLLTPLSQTADFVDRLLLQHHSQWPQLCVGFEFHSTSQEEKWGACSLDTGREEALFVNAPRSEWCRRCLPIRSDKGKLTKAIETSALLLPRSLGR